MFVRTPRKIEKRDRSIRSGIYRSARPPRAAATIFAVVGALAALSSLFAARVSAEIVGEPSGRGPFPAVVETRPELPEHTVYRPAEWPDEPLPLYVWGNGGCGNNGLAHAAYLYHIASHGYVVVALGIPGGGPPPPADGSRDATHASQMLEAIDWASRETAREGGHFEGRIRENA